MAARTRHINDRDIRGELASASCDVPTGQFLKRKVHIGDDPPDDRIAFFQLCDGLLGGVCCHDGVAGIFQTRDDDLFDQRLVLHHQYEYVVGQNRSVPW
ncbi:hypothetical protein C100_12200 [Sphingobium sp. C100]|nr:hypothetical protein C100_12200 [Sphingobium sp. C100]